MAQKKHENSVASRQSDTRQWTLFDSADLVRKKKVLNIYRDNPSYLMLSRGADISSARLDSLDFSYLSFAMNRLAENTNKKRKLNIVDLGCGLGVPTMSTAFMGASCYFFDIVDLFAYYASYKKINPKLQIKFRKADISKAHMSIYPKKIDVIYSQRTIHYLRFSEAESLVGKMYSRLSVGGRAFISVSGLDSELGDGYEDKRLDVRDRFSLLSGKMSEKHGIQEQVCLYRPDDLEKMMSFAGFRTLNVEVSEFGNVKGIFEKL